jgi:glucosamine--fructose-6-phosphate aminotransferase (isomerizing)
MCGIFGILKKNDDINITQIIIDGLVQLQNRGYDSSGICLLKNKELIINKFASTTNETSIEKLSKINIDSTNINIGIGHNRWATHGGKTDNNAHPHISNNKKFCLVHNGIIENYRELKEHLIKNGYTFYSQTDTEIIVNLIDFHYNKTNNTVQSIKNTIENLEGTYGIIVINKDEPNNLYTVRNGSPILVGYTDEYAIITSEQSGFCNMVNTYITLQNDDICVIKLNDKVTIETTNTYIDKKVNINNYELTPAPYLHWTIKEIYEQPDTVLNAINRGGRIKNKSEVKLGGLENNIENLKNINNIILLGCGTSYHAALYGMIFLKKMCNFNTVQVFDGAEFNEYDIPKNGITGVILISQSGETKDLHRCIDIAKKNDMVTIGIINVVDSLIAREVDCGIYCNAGREIGVASTKAFTSQVICLSLLSIWFAQIHNVNLYLRIKFIQDLQNLSNDIKNTLINIDDQIKEVAMKYIDYKNIFILGKGTDEYIAKEGSLKIKEIAYIHCEGYSASSLKHGPFALLDENFATIIINCCEEYNSKIENCYQEVASRNSPIILTTNNHNNKNDGTKIIVQKNESFSSLLGIFPLQLLAYYLSIFKGINPDIPKNLAKVVTVE